MCLRMTMWRSGTRICITSPCSTSAELRARPCIYLVIRGGHFKALSKPDTAPRKNHAHSVLDLFKTETDPATSKCESGLLWNRVHDLLFRRAMVERLHLQTMMSGDWSMRKCNTVEMKKVIDKQKIFARPYNLKVQMHNG